MGDAEVEYGLREAWSRLDQAMARLNRAKQFLDEAPQLMHLSIKVEREVEHVQEIRDEIMAKLERKEELGVF